MRYEERFLLLILVVYGAVGCAILLGWALSALRQLFAF